MGKGERDRRKGEGEGGGERGRREQERNSKKERVGRREKQAAEMPVKDLPRISVTPSSMLSNVGPVQFHLLALNWKRHSLRAMSKPTFTLDIWSM